MKNTIKFGVEIEYKDAKASTVQSNLNKKSITNIQEGYHASNNFTVWKVCSDSSVSTGYGRNMRGGELVSPVLTIDNLDQIDAVCDALQKSNATVNRQCGLHVHISWESMNGKTIKKIVDRYKMFEYEMDRFMPPSRQGNENRYCRSLVNIDFSRSPNANYLSDLVGNKFSKVNTSNLTSRTKTIEFRHHSGTTDYNKIANWIEFLQYFVAQSIKIKQAFKFDHAYKPRAKSKSYASLREQIARAGGKLLWKGGKWKIINDRGTVYYYTTNELEYLYDLENSVGRNFKIHKVRFDAFITAIFGEQTNEDSDESLYAGIPHYVQEFFRMRTAQLQGA